MKDLKNKYPELYEAIVAHSVGYDCEVGEGNVVDDMALPLGWLGVYLDIVRKKGYEEGQEDMSEKIDDIKSDERKRCLESIDKLMNENSLDRTQLVIDRQSWKNLKDQAISAITNQTNK